MYLMLHSSAGYRLTSLNLRQQGRQALPRPKNWHPFLQYNGSIHVLLFILYTKVASPIDITQ